MTAHWQEPVDPVEDYLDDLLLALSGSPRHVRHTLAEVQAHLDDAVAAGTAAGLSDTEARAAAVRDLGPVEGVASRSAGRRSNSPLRRRIVLGMLLVAGVGGVAIGLGGLGAAFVRGVGGNRLVGAPFPTGSYTATDCARWLSNYPRAQNCLSAMTQDHADDFLRDTAQQAFSACCRWWPMRCFDVAGGIARSRGRYPGGSSSSPAPASRGRRPLLSGQGVDAVLVTRGTGAGASLALAAAALGTAVGFAVAAKRVSHRPLMGHLRR